MKTPVHVAGLGVVSAIGNTVAENIVALEHSHSGIGPITFLETIYKDYLPVGEVKLTNKNLSTLLNISKPVSRTAMLGLLAAREAWVHARLDNHKLRIGFVSATTVGGMDGTEKFAEAFFKDKTQGWLRDVLLHECGSTTEWIADQLISCDFISTINTACSSSVNSIMLGSRLIEQDRLDVVIAGGTDALTRFTLNGFNSLMILDKEPCKPFDANRQGLNLGEGAGYVVLVSDKVRKQQQLTSFAQVSGYGNTNDAFHQTASSPDGRGPRAAMELALKKSNLSESDIDYINLHGTGTVNNDSSEGTAVQTLFKNNVPRLSSTKAYTGHTLGASGGVEAVYSVLALLNQCVYPNLRFEHKIPELNFIPQAQFEKDLRVQHVLSNSFGFGGNCSSIIFSRS